MNFLFAVFSFNFKIELYKYYYELMNGIRRVWGTGGTWSERQRMRKQIETEDKMQALNCFTFY